MLVVFMRSRHAILFLMTSLGRQCLHLLISASGWTRIEPDLLQHARYGCYCALTHNGQHAMQFFILTVAQTEHQQYIRYTSPVAYTFTFIPGEVLYQLEWMNEYIHE